MPQSSVSVPVASNWPTLSCDCLAHRFGNAADHSDRRPVYPTDMSDAEWAVVRDAMPVPGWLEGRGGQPEGYCHRQMIDAVRYLNDNGCRLVHLVGKAMPGITFDIAALYGSPNLAAQIEYCTRQFGTGTETLDPVDDLEMILARVQRGELSETEAARLLSRVPAMDAGAAT